MPRQPIKSIVLTKQITRADGTVEPETVAAYWHRSRFKRLVARLRGEGAGGKVKAPCA